VLRSSSEVIPRARRWRLPTRFVFRAGLVLVVCTVFNPACASRKRSADLKRAAEAKRNVEVTEIKPTQTSRDYTILPADTLEISVFQEPDMKSTLRVSDEGTIAFPLIGVVKVGGLTPQGAAQTLRDRLARGYLINPQVSVTVMEFSKRRFTVLGEVQKPGSYDMPDQQTVTVLQAIGMAGGYTRIANASRITLMRKQGGSSETFAINAKKMAAGNAESAFPVLPGDVITVAESRF
jgi:protein involved in polysaccharide export with SLBB domain